MLHMQQTRSQITAMLTKKKNSNRGMGNNRDSCYGINKPIEQKDQPSSISATESKQQGWASVHVVCNQIHQMRNKIILDSGSSTTLFCNKIIENRLKKQKIQLIYIRMQA